jgi:hypothetical protein
MSGQSLVKMATIEQCMSNFYSIIKQTDIFVRDYSTSYYEILRESSGTASSSKKYVDRFILYATGSEEEATGSCRMSLIFGYY